MPTAVGDVQPQKRYSEPMTKKRKTVELNLNERLRDSRTQATSMTLPLAVHHKLELLAELAKDINASRADVIGALIAEADLDDALEARILAYRKLTVRDVLKPDELDRELGDNVISIETRGPGRPRRDAGAS